MVFARPGRDRGRRRRHLLTLRSLIATLLLGTVLVACTTTGTSGTSTSSAAAGPADTAVAQFTSAWQSANVDQIAALTSDPAGATETIGSAVQNLQPASIAVSAADIRTDGNSATATAHFVWSLPKGVSWAYDANWTLHSSAKGWTVDWSPTVIHPQLGPAQSLALRTSDAGAGEIVDRNNQQLVSAVIVHSVVALPGKVGNLSTVAATLTKILSPYDKTVTAASVIAGVQKADKQSGYTVTNLRDNEFNAVQAQLAAIPGLVFPQQTRNLPPTKDFAKILLSQATPVAEKLLTGTPGWRVVTIDSTGAELATLASQEATPGANVVLTIDSTLQTAAEKALAGVPEPAVLVAIQPSTGEILAVAQNAAANAQGPIALMGEYPPGSIFKIVTATAVFDAKLANPDSQEPCPGVFTVDSREIHNEGFDLGTVPLTTAFAKSCNTTFAELATQLPNTALPDTAKQYSIGLDFVVPGITTLTGKIQAPDSSTAAAEAGFGQGTDLVTPFSAALMAATAATGNMPTPVLIRGQKTTADQAAPPRSQAVQSNIRTLMRAVVTDGTATTLADDGEVYAKTGTADNAGAKAHAWTVGFRGDVAFAALIVGGDTSKRTNTLIDQFLKAIPAS
jgi:cell division protein FtsI/penicillin-binding protein 2